MNAALFYDSPMHGWIKTRLRDIGKNLTGLAEALSLPNSRITDIIKGEREVKALEAAIIADYLGLTADEVLNRLGAPENDDGFRVVRPPVIHVPLISWVQAGELADISDPFPPGLADEWVAVSSMRSSLIALELRGTSINRRVPDGSTVIVDYLDTDLVPGKVYAFRTGGDQGAVKVYKNNPPRFEPDSTDPHETIFPDESTHIIGRVINAVSNL